MTVFLPEMAPVAAADTRPVRAAGRRPESETILLVEDDPSVRGLTQHILRMNGYTVHEACDGMQALDLVRQGTVRVDLLITDMVMPGMNGKELAARLRSQLHALRVLYVSGYSDKHPLVLDDQMSSTFLQKPFSPEDLIRKVREILNAPEEGRAAS
jgi:CheY-like chemotaxis protein